jgi:hypothetical protein
MMASPKLSFWLVTVWKLWDEQLFSPNSYHYKSIYSLRKFLHVSNFKDPLWWTQDANWSHATDNIFREDIYVWPHNNYKFNNIRWDISLTRLQFSLANNIWRRLKISLSLGVRESLQEATGRFKLGQCQLTSGNLSPGPEFCRQFG